MKKVLNLSILLLLLTPLYASSLSLDAGVRERFESLNVMNKKAYGDDASLIGHADDSHPVSRLKLGFIYKQTPDIIYTVVGYFASGNMQKIWSLKLFMPTLMLVLL